MKPDALSSIKFDICRTEYTSYASVLLDLLGTDREKIYSLPDVFEYYFCI